MPNAVIERYRQAYPQDQRSDPELTVVLGDIGRSLGDHRLEDDPAFRKEYLDLKLSLAPSLAGELTRTIGSGIDQVQAKLYDTVGLAGRAMQEGGLFSSGLDIATGGALSRRMQAFGKEGYERNLSEAGAGAPTIQDVGDVRNTSEAIRYGVGLFGQQAPQLAGSILGGVAGGLAGGAIAGPPGVAAGATIGATSFSFTQNQIHGELAKQIGASDVVPTAIGVGAFSALLDSIVPLKLGHTILKGVEGKIARDYMGKVLRHVPVNALTEGTTEALQEVTAIAGEMFANRDNPTFSISPNEIRKRVVNAAVAGVLLGGATGPFEAIAGKPPGTYLAEPPPALPAPQPVPPVLSAAPAPAVTAQQVNATAAGQSGYVNVAQPTVDELAALAQRELSGQLTQLEKAALIRTPDLALAYETILNQLKQAAPVPPEPTLPPTEVPVPAAEVPTATAPPPAPPAPPEAESVPVPEVVPPKPGSPVAPALPFVDRINKAVQDGIIAAGWGKLSGSRPGIFVRIGNGWLPFYRSSQGTGGAKKAGEWQPFFGFGRTQEGGTETEWFIKGTNEQIATGYGRPEILAAQKWLNENFNWPHESDLDLQFNPQLSPLASSLTHYDYGAALEQLLGKRAFEDIAADNGTSPPHIEAILNRLLGASPRSRLLSVLRAPAEALTSMLRTRAVEAALERRAKPAVAALAALPVAPVVAVAPAPAVPVVPAAPALDHDEFIGNIDWDPNVKRGRPVITELPSAELVDRNNLADVITRGARDESENTPLAQTRRITFFRNLDTGQIHGLGTYDVRNPKVVDPAKAKKKLKNTGISINKFLAHGSKENSNKRKWVPLASVRIKRNVLDMHFEMTEEQWQALSKKLSIRQAEADADTNVVASTGKKASTALVDEGLASGSGSSLVVDEHPETSEKIEGEGGPSTEDDPPLEETGLDSEQVRSLWETIASNPGKSVRQIIQENAANLAEILKGWQGTTTQILDALDRSFDQPSFGQFYEAFDPNGYKLYQSTPGAGTSPRTDTGRENGPVEELNLSVPEGAVAPLLPLAEVRARFNQVIQALREFGIGIQGFQVLVREVGSYDNANRLVTLSMFDMANPSVDNLRMAMHEAAHALFASFPIPVQQAIHTAINGMSDEALGLSASPDPRIRRDNPRGLDPALLSEERLAEFLALAGVSREVATDIASRLIRFLKNLYYQAMMGLQQAFGRNPSPELAMAYAQNRFNQMLSAGVRSKTIFDTALAPSPVAEQAMWYEPVDANAQPKVNPDGTVTYPMMVPDTQAARDFNIKYTFFAFHGTPHRFNSYSLSRTRTGEGGMMFGWGAYFAQNPEVAKTYSERGRNYTFTIDGKPLPKDSPLSFQHAVLGEIARHGYESALSGAKVDLKSATTMGRRAYTNNKIKLIESLKGKKIEEHLQKGNLYHAILDVENEDLLDLDKTLEEQPRILEKLWGLLQKLERDPDYYLERPIEWEDFTGKQLYKELESRAYNGKTLNEKYKGRPADEQASMTLLDLGIKGSKFLDRFSRRMNLTPPPADSEIISMREFTRRDRVEKGVKLGTLLEESEQDFIIVHNGTAIEIGANNPIFDSVKAAQEWLDRHKNQPTHNFVIFDDKLIQLMTRNDQFIRLPAQEGPPVGLKFSTPEPEIEYGFTGGPRQTDLVGSEGAGAGDPMMKLIDMGKPAASGYASRSQNREIRQAQIEASNAKLDAELKAKGILKYSQPEYVGLRENPATVPETQIAAFNAQKAAEALILPELEKNGRIMAIVGDRRKTDPNYNALSWFRNEFGLEDPNLLIQEQLRRPDGNGTNARPDATVDSFTSEVNRQWVARAAYSLLASARDRIGKKQANALIGIGEAEEARVKAAQELQDSARDYLNFEGLTKLMTTQVKFILGRLFRDLRAESFNLGVIAQQLQALRGAGDLTPYLAEFRSLTRSEGTYPRLMALLDRMANDPAIDLNASITAIKAAMLPNPAYSDLTSGLPSGDAMLATLVAYAKTSPRLATLLALRRMTNTAQRTAISAQVQTLLRQGLAVATRGPNRLTKISSIEERLKAAFQADKRAVEALQAKKAKQELQVQAAGPAIRLFDDAANKLAGRIGLHAPAVIGQDMLFLVPPTFNATWEEVTRNPKKLQLDTNLEPVDAKTQALAAQVGITLDQPTGPTPRSVLEDYIGKMNDWLAWKESNKDIDGHYFEIKAYRDELLSNGVFSPRVVNTSYTMLGLKFADAATQAKSFGTPGARLLAKVLNHFSQILGSLKPDGHRQGVKNERLRSEALAMLSKGTKMGVSLENYQVHFYNPAWTILERNRDILELSTDKERQWDIAFQRILDRFQQGGVTAPLIAGKELRFMTAFRKHMESEWASSKATVNTLENKGVGVTDESLPVVTPSGERVPGVRQHIGEGVATMPATISNTFSLVVDVLKKLNWAAFSEILKAKGVVADGVWLDQVVQPFFNNADVQKYFFKEFTNTDTISSFTAPKLSDKETRPEANPNYCAEAYGESGGSIKAFIQRMYELHDGDPENQSLDEYGMDVLRTFSRLFGQMNKVNGEINPDTRDDSHVIAEWKTMIPGFMVNARVIKHWPAIYRNYLMFDRRTMFRVNARVAAEIAFGVEQGRIANAYEVALKEAAVGIQRLDNAKAKVQNTLISASRKEIEAAMAAEVGGKETLKRLRKLQQRSEKFLAGPKSIRAELFTFFRGADSPVRTVRFMQQLLGLFSSMMLNQPGSAIGQLADLFAPIMTFGVSAATIRQVARTIGISGIDVTTGLLTPLGLSFALTERMQQRYNELGQGDPLALAKLKDLLLRETSPFDGTKMNMIIAGMRKLQEAQEFGIGKKKNPRTVARLAAPFRWVSMVVNRGNVCSTWNTVNDYVARGMKAYQSGISASDDELANWTPEQWAKEMDMGRADANSFRTMTTLMLDDWGLDFFRLVREGIANVKENKDALSNDTLMRVQGMVLKEVTSETSIATMPLASFNSSAIKFISPLLGWPFRRAMDVAGSFKDVNGRASWAAVGNSLLAMAAMGAGGLAVSMLVDVYNENALRKRRNLRRLTLDDPTNLVLSVIEHTDRVGTLGLFGSILNESVGSDKGGANRGVSIDNRIVFVSSLLGIMRSISALSHEGWSAEYATVIRPLAYSLGGNSALQFLQLANGVFARAGLDPLFEKEAAATQRTNISNWLRAAGRELDFEIASRAGYGGSPTPVTPYISRMSLAAYSDNPSEFAEAYRDAINEVRTTRHLDLTEATQSIKRSFSSRHPLRATFRASLTEREYRSLLEVMPDTGADAVRDAVNLYNRYLERIGMKGFDGKSEDDTPKNVLRLPKLPLTSTVGLRQNAIRAALSR